MLYVSPSLNALLILYFAAMGVKQIGVDHVIEEQKLYPIKVTALLWQKVFRFVP